MTLAELIREKKEKEIAEIIEGTKWNKPRIPTTPLDLLSELGVTRFGIIPVDTNMITAWIKRKYWKRAVLRWAMNEKSGEVFIRMGERDKYLEIYRTGRGKVTITAITRGEVNGAGCVYKA